MTLAIWAQTSTVLRSRRPVDMAAFPMPFGVLVGPPPPPAKAAPVVLVAGPAKAKAKAAQPPPVKAKAAKAKMAAAKMAAAKMAAPKIAPPVKAKAMLVPKAGLGQIVPKAGWPAWTAKAKANWRASQGPPRMHPQPPTVLTVLRDDGPAYAGLNVGSQTAIAIASWLFHQSVAVRGEWLERMLHLGRPMLMADVTTNLVAQFAAVHRRIDMAMTFGDALVVTHNGVIM